MLWIPQVKKSSKTESQSINIIIFPEVIAVEVLRDFTAKTGITVHAKNVESDAEMCIYLNNPDNSYDAICIPEYLIAELERLETIKPIDTHHLSNYKNIHSIFKEEKQFVRSIPFSWGLFGIGIDKKNFPKTEDRSWSLLFEKHPQKICVSDDPRSLVVMGALALHYPTETLSKNQVIAIATLLSKQKPNIEIYTDTNIALLFANQIVPLAFTSYKSMVLANKYNPNAKFIIPKEGGIRIAQHWIIPSNSKKKNASYAFLNFMLSTKVSSKIEKLTEFLPTNCKILNRYWTAEEQSTNNCPLPSEEIIRATHLAPSNLSPKLLSALWITLKNT